MAALTRPTEATYVLHEQVTVDTTDNEDHTFSGVIFPVECKAGLPIDHMAITGISVRGLLGPLTIWINQDPDEDNEAMSNEEADKEEEETITADRSSTSHRNRSRHSGNPTGRRSSYTISINRNHWTKIYEKQHKPSFRHFEDLTLATPIKLKPGRVRGIYIHSGLPGDQSIVYDNQKGPFTHDDYFLRIHPGLAHLSSTPFGNVPPWGFGSCWRENREFVGRVSYGVVYKLWNPKEYLMFGSKFQITARTLFACQRRFESPLSRMPDDVIFYILNMCRWDWFDDSAEQLIQERKRALADEEAVTSAVEESEEEEEEEADEDDENRRVVFRPHRRQPAPVPCWSQRGRVTHHRGVLLFPRDFDDPYDSDFVYESSDNESMG